MSLLSLRSEVNGSGVAAAFGQVPLIGSRHSQLQLGLLGVMMSQGRPRLERLTPPTPRETAGSLEWLSLVFYNLLESTRDIISLVSQHAPLRQPRTVLSTEALYRAKRIGFEHHCSLRLQAVCADCCLELEPWISLMPELQEMERSVPRYSR
ncbi:hypothetical protein AOLI_G00204080 [Acnodon oligacanthus]